MKNTINNKQRKNDELNTKCIDIAKKYPEWIKIRENFIGNMGAGFGNEYPWERK